MSGDDGALEITTYYLTWLPTGNQKIFHLLTRTLYVSDGILNMPLPIKYHEIN